ncbi:MAG: tetratricopeptide repeat protein [Salibacteraceae bacterium]
MKHCLLFFGLLMLVGQLLAENDSRSHYELSFDSANVHYNEGNYTEAIESYRAIVQAGYVSSTLYFNLGNAYFKTEELPSAILFYEKAQKMAPGDPDIAFNLQLAHSQTVDKIETLGDGTFSKWWLGVIHLLPADVWGGLAIAFMVFLVAGLFGFINTQKVAQKRLLLFLSSSALVLFGTFLWLGLQQHSYQTTIAEAIVFSPTVTIKSEPNAQGNQLFNLHEGTKVALLESVNGWYNIRLADGKTGWIQEQDLRMI